MANDFDLHPRRRLSTAAAQRSSRWPRISSGAESESRSRTGFLAGNRGAVSVACTYPDGRRVVEHALLTLRDGRIARWDGVQAWDE